LVEEIASEASAAIDVDGVTQELEDQLSAQWGVKMQVRDDGRVVQTGVALGASIGADGQTRSEFLVQADTVAFLNTVNGQIHSPFVFDVANDTAFLKSAFIQSASIDNAKIANGSITNAKIENAAIDSAKIADGSITSAKIGDAQITNAKIGHAQVDTLKISGNAVTVHAHAQQAGSVWSSAGSGATCSLFLAQPGTLSIFANITGWMGQTASSSAGNFGIYVNGTNVLGITLIVAHIYDNWSGPKPQGIGETRVINVSVGAGTNTISLIRQMSGLGHNLSLVVLAAMR